MYASPRGRARLAEIALGVQAIALAVLAASTFQEVTLLRNIIDGEYAVMPDAEFWALADANDSRQAIVRLLYLATFIFTIFAFLMWQHRIRKNADYVGVTGLRFSMAGVIGWWFVPIMNLFRPYQVMKEMWQSNYHDVNEQPEWRDSTVSGLLGWWWGLFLVGGWVAYGAGNLRLRSDPNLLITGGWMEIVSSAIWMLSAVIAIALVREITAFQESKQRAYLWSGRR